jgi:hypothetical protein
MDNTKPGIPVSQQRSGRPIKSISQRLKAKPATTSVLAFALEISSIALHKCLCALQC